MPWSPAVTRMKVNPRPAQTLVSATDIRAVSGSRSSPGDLTTGNRSLIHETLESTPTDGSSRNSHIRLATATDVAIVEEKMARKMPMPRRYLSASTARPTPSASPSGTVMSANLNVTKRASWNSLLRPRRRIDPTRWTGSCSPERRSASGRARRPARAGRGRTRSGSPATGRASRPPSAHRASETRSTAGWARPQCRPSTRRS